MKEAAYSCGPRKALKPANLIENVAILKGVLHITVFLHTTKSYRRLKDSRGFLSFAEIREIEISGRNRFNQNKQVRSDDSILGLRYLLIGC